MNITSQYAVTIFRNDYNDKAYYRIGLSNKKQDGTYENGYMTARFKKGVELNNQTKIYLKSAWLSFYKDKENKTVPYIFINDFNLVEEEIAEAKKEVEIKNDPFTAFAKANEEELDQLDLPF